MTYTIEVTNTGNVPVELKSLVDDKFGDLDGVGTCNGATNTYPTALVPLDTYSCVFTKTLPAAQAGSKHVNTVTATAEDENGTQTTDDDDETVTFDDVAAAIRITKSALTSNRSCSTGSRL